jgi:hypothetical protein
MNDFQRTLRNLAAAAILVGVSAAVADAQTSVVAGSRTRGFDLHRQPDAAGPPGISAVGKGLVTGNCLTNPADRVVGAQRVWTQHGVIALGGNIERAPLTECR